MSEVRYIKNAIVKENYWDADGFYEHKADNTFVAAVNIYDTTNGEKLAVIFQVGKAYLLNDTDYNRPVTRDEFTEVLHDLVTEYGSDFDIEEVLPDNYIELSTGNDVDEDLAEEYGLDDEICADIEERIADLSGYVDVEYEDMF